MDKSSLVFTGILIKEEEGYSALCLEVDVASQGETLEEAKKNLMEAVTLYLENAIESNLPIIRPVPEEENPLRVDPARVVEVFKINIDIQIKAYV